MTSFSAENFYHFFSHWSVCSGASLVSPPHQCAAVSDFVRHFRNVAIVFAPHTSSASLLLQEMTASNSNIEFQLFHFEVKAVINEAAFPGDSKNRERVLMGVSELESKDLKSLSKPAKLYLLGALVPETASVCEDSAFHKRERKQPKPPKVMASLQDQCLTLTTLAGTRVLPVLHVLTVTAAFEVLVDVSYHFSARQLSFDLHAVSISKDNKDETALFGLQFCPFSMKLLWRGPGTVRYGFENANRVVMDVHTRVDKNKENVLPITFDRRTQKLLVGAECAEAGFVHCAAAGKVDLLEGGPVEELLEEYPQVCCACLRI